MQRITDAVAKLMAGDAADLVFTDPPYNVDYEGYTEERLKIKGDRMSDADFKQFLERAFRSYRSVVKPGASMYVCHSSSWQREFQNALEVGRLRGSLPDHLGEEHVCLGLRPLQVPARADVLLPRRRREGSLVRRQDAIDALAGEEARGEPHPPDGEAGGTGRARAAEQQQGRRRCSGSVRRLRVSTLIGCERRGRNARLMEIDPKYADCIVRRYQEYTGKQAVLDGDGRTFEEVALERAGAPA